MAGETRPYNRKWQVPVLFAIVVAIVMIGIRAEMPPQRAWYTILALLFLFALIAGQGLTGSWRGLLIDERNKMSLSRLQLLSWTLVILSAIMAAAMSNVARGLQAPLDFTIPSELWVLMGISTTSLIAAPAILSNAKEKVEKRDKGEAAWGDLLCGEETSNDDKLDLGKMQMFFFTLILIVAYGAQLRGMFIGADTGITSLPIVEGGMNVLLGISHTGYLASKAVPRNAKPPKETQDS